MFWRVTSKPHTQLHVLVERVRGNITLCVHGLAAEDFVGTVQCRTQVRHTAVQEERGKTATKIETQVKVRKLIAEFFGNSVANFGAISGSGPNAGASWAAAPAHQLPATAATASGSHTSLRVRAVNASRICDTSTQYGTFRIFRKVRAVPG